MTFAEMCGIYDIIGCTYVPKEKKTLLNQSKSRLISY